MVVTRIGRGEDRTGGLLFIQHCLSPVSDPALCPVAFCWWRGVGMVKGDSGWWNRGEKGKVLESEKQ